MSEQTEVQLTVGAANKKRGADLGRPVRILDELKCRGILAQAIGAKPIFGIRSS